MKKLILLLFLALTLQVHAQSTGKTEALEALGGSGGLLLYNTYMVIGVAADAYVGKVYDAAMVEKIVAEQLGGVKTVEEQYGALIKSKFLSDPEDKQFLTRMLDAFDLVRTEGQALIDYVHSESEEDAASYENSRKEAWSEVADLLGMEE